MTRAKYPLFSLGILLLVVFGLACSLISDITNRVSSAQETAQAVSTEIQEGRKMISTGEALITQVQGSGALETIQAAATKIERSGLPGTVQAVATDLGQSGLLETAQAMVTEQGPALEATGQALATEMAGGGMGEKPIDIPVMEGRRQNYFTSPQLVSYSIVSGYQSVLDFYNVQMPANGWEQMQIGTAITENGAVIAFEKSNRRAFVTITPNPLTGQTIVVITLEG